MSQNVLPSSLSIACDFDHDVSSMLAQAVTIALLSRQVMRVSRKRQRDETTSNSRGGSLPGKRANNNIGRGEGARKIDRDYFCRLSDHVTFTPIFDEDVLSRRYRVPRDVYERIRDGLLTWNDNYFVQKRDCCGVLGASTDQKMWSAMRQLAYGLPADATVEYGRLAETTNLACLKMFCKGVVDMFETEWLRLPNTDDATQIERHYRTLGFPGCLGSVDCASWEWDACPIGWQGLCKGKGPKPGLRMEVICDDFLRIWWLNFGAPGAKNDVNILNQSLFFNKIRTGVWPPTLPEVEVAGFKFNWFYFLADGIYPRYRFLMSSFASPSSEAEKLFAAHQEGAREAVERVLEFYSSALAYFTDRRAFGSKLTWTRSSEQPP
jgi:hypothetical protein